MANRRLPFKQSKAYGVLYAITKILLTRIKHERQLI